MNKNIILFTNILIILFLIVFLFTCNDSSDNDDDNNNDVGNGLCGEYYNQSDFGTYRFSQVDTNIDFNWSTDSPHETIKPDTFTIRWVGQIKPLYSETYTFYAYDYLQLYQAIIKSLSKAIAISDPNGQIIYSNPAHEKLFNRTLNETRKLNYCNSYPKVSIKIPDVVVSTTQA